MRKAHREWVRSLSLEHKRETLDYNFRSAQKSTENAIHVEPQKDSSKNKNKRWFVE